MGLTELWVAPRHARPHRMAGQRGCAVKHRAKARVRTLRFKPQASALRLAITFVALIAFAFQSYVTQTHIHSAASIGASGPAANKADAASGKPDKFPANQDPSNCPICQEILHSGNFVTPSAIAALPPALSISIIAVRLDTAIAPQAVSHSWRGRAPPHA